LGTPSETPTDSRKSRELIPWQRLCIIGYSEWIHPMNVLILLPVLNERDNIEELLDRIDKALVGAHYTVCIVDDGSRDGTVEFVETRMSGADHHLHLIRRVKKSHGSKRGGALHESLRWGLENTDHQVFVEIDGDLSHRPEELPLGIDMITREGYDVAIASKYLPGSRVTNRPRGRLMVSRICGFAVRTVISRKVRDYSNGYRFYSRAAAEMIASHEIRYTSPIYLTEVLALWLREALRIGEFPTTYIGRNEGLSKLRFIDLFKAGLAIFEVASRYHFRGFRANERFPRALKASVAGVGRKSGSA
jgi:dolichol-phosphate mannosyltransferase